MGCFDFIEEFENCETWKDAWRRWYAANQPGDDESGDDAYENGYGVKDGCSYLGEKESPKEFINTFLETHDWSELKWQNALCIGDASKEGKYFVFGVMSC